MKRKYAVPVLMAIFLTIGSVHSAMALGVKTEIDTRNDTFANRRGGLLLGKQTVMAGVGHNLVGQRVRAAMPDLGSVTYTSRNNTYTNNGKIKGTQNVIGGAGFQAVGQEVY